jgi:hypothetical protein
VSGTLTLEERGLLAALAALGAEKAAADRVLGGEGAKADWRRLQELPREQRVTALAVLLRDLLTPLPPGIETLHPSWVAEALASEPPELAAALAPGGEEGGGGMSLEPEVRRQLRRVVFAPLEPLAAEPAGPLGAQLAALAEPELLFEVTRRGARTLGASLAGAPLESRARAMASIGAPWASELAAEAARHLDPTARNAARALVTRAATVPAPTPLDRLHTLGLLTLAPALAAEGLDSLRRVAGRLPAALGRALLTYR